jgi:predicted HicB family RNase H-like nuclease
MKAIEKKKPHNLMIKPSVAIAAKKKAKKERSSLSQVVENLLKDYSWKS